MTVQPEHAHAVVTRCWCCGGDFPEAELVRLGRQPEVGVCLACANWLRRRALLRRDARRGRHERAWLGPVLRWIDRHLP